jgi:hypothetical protein
VFFAEIIWFWIFGKAEVKRPVEVRVHPTLEAAEEEKAPVDTEKITRMFRVVDAEEPRLPTIAEESLEDLEAEDELTVAIEMPQEPKDDDRASVKSFGYLFGQKLSVYAGFDEPLIVVNLEEV